MGLVYKIRLTNVENADIEVNIDDDDISATGVLLDGAENTCVLDTVESDDDKTKVIKGRRLTIGFNSYDEDNIHSIAASVDTFADGDDDRFKVSIDNTTIGGILADQLSPFIGNLVLDDNSEAFQPRPNPVQLRAGEGLGSLKDVPLRESDGDVPVGHYRIIDYIYLCLIDLFEIGSALPELHVAMNLYETDTDPDTSHAFFDTFLDARTFETDVNERDDKFTVLTKILDAFGCFITYHSGGWYIIRWDEYDLITTGATFLRFANFQDNSGFYEFVDYENIDVDKIIAHDQDVLYEGYFLSMDSAIKRFQRRAHSVAHTYRLEQPKEIPCNSGFLRGTVDDDVLPLKTYDPECWNILRGWGANSTTPNSVAQIWVRFDANDNESERYMTLTPQASSGGEFNYIRSEAIPIDEKDKFEFSFDYSADSDNGTNGPASIGIGVLVLYGFDNSVWILGDNITALGDEQVPEWKLSDTELATNNDYYKWFFSGSSGSEDYTEFRNYSIEAPPAPVAGNLYVHLFAANQLGSGIDDFVIRYNNLQFTYTPYINGTYGRIAAQEHKVTGQNDSRKNIEHEMFIGESTKPLLKGVLKKFDGVNYIPTETWNYYHDPTVLTDSKLGKHTVFAWWNQFRKTRTVIETDIQGLNSTEEDGLPSMIHRWKINHGDQEEKKFMLTSFRGMDFYKCGWQGVFVETSEEDGDRVYTGLENAFTFKYIQE